MRSTTLSAAPSAHDADSSCSPPQTVTDWLAHRDIDLEADLAGWFSSTTDFLADEELNPLSEFERLEVRAL